MPIDARLVARMLFRNLLEAISFRAIHMTDLGGESILVDKTTIFEDLVDLPVLPGGYDVLRICKK